MFRCTFRINKTGFTWVFITDEPKGKFAELIGKGVLHVAPTKRTTYILEVL